VELVLASSIPLGVEGYLSVTSVFAVIFIVLFGTLVAFYCYLESLKYLCASETSILACIEPLSSAILSVVWLNVPFGLGDWIGTLSIISTVAILSIVKDKKSL
jgi:drug/metabolite transporter (DMT)-like permease